MSIGLTEVSKLMAQIAKDNEDRFKNPIEFLHAVQLRVRAKKMPTPTQIYGSVYMDPSLGIPVEGTGMPMSWKGNKSIYCADWLEFYQGRNMKLAEQVTMYLMMAREFRYLGEGRYNPKVLTQGLKFADPVFCQVNSIVPGKYSDLGYVLGKRLGPCNTSRLMASTTASVAYDYAQDVDGKPDDVTRRGACKSGEEALKYALHIDGCFHAMTFATIAREPRFWGRYAAKCPEARPLFEPRITDPETMKRYVSDCPDSKDKTHVLNAISLVGYDYFRHLLGARADGTPDPDIRDAILKKYDAQAVKNEIYTSHLIECAKKTGDKSHEYMNRILADGEPGVVVSYAQNLGVKNDQLRDACCRSSEYAVRYAQNVGGKDPVIEQAACRKSIWALQYARLFGPSDATRIAASKDPDIAYEYADEVDKGPHPVTKEACSYDDRLERRYKENIEAQGAKQ